MCFPVFFHQQATFDPAVSYSNLQGLTISTMVALFQHLLVEITVDGKSLTEYEDKRVHERKLNTVTRYIEAVQDELYSVYYTLPKNFTKKRDIEVEIEVDGEWVASRIHRKGLEDEIITETIGETLAKMGGHCLGQRFQFSELITGKSPFVSHDSA